MTKSEFLEKLTAELRHNNAEDAADIIQEYDQHFIFKLADGYSEEEIAAKLGDPKAIAAQYDAVPADNKSGKKVITAIGLGTVDFFFGILCMLLYAWTFIMATLVIACCAMAVGLVINGRVPVFGFMPLPYYCALLIGIAFIALAVLSAVGTVYFCRFIRQLIRSYGRFHKNALTAASGKATLPSVSAYPQFSAKHKRALRKLAVIAAIALAVCFIIGFIACVFSAGAIEFWHTWGWFGYIG